MMTSIESLQRRWACGGFLPPLPSHVSFQYRDPQYLMLTKTASAPTPHAPSHRFRHTPGGIDPDARLGLAYEAGTARPATPSKHQAGRHPQGSLGQGVMVHGLIRQQV